MPAVAITFHHTLNDFLPRDLRGTTIGHSFDFRASIKDTLESLGPPHPEIALIAASGRSVGFDYIVEDRDDIHVYPETHLPDFPGRVLLRPPLPRPPCFVLDIHLGRLAAYLRMMGFDTAYGDTNDHAGAFNDALLAQTAHEENRVMLSRDVGLLKRSTIVYGYWVRNKEPRQQLIEIVNRFQLRPEVQPFRRCMACNGLLAPVEKSEIRHLLKPKTDRHVDEFHQCQSCQQVYWQGLHTERMQHLIEDVLARTGKDSPVED